MVVCGSDIGVSKLNSSFKIDTDLRRFWLFLSLNS